jgi:hypothetical protein
MTNRERETLRRFVAECARLWPGCGITIRHREPAAVTVLKGFIKQQQKFAPEREEAPDPSSGNQKDR